MGGLSASDEDSSTSPAHSFIFLLRPQLAKGFMQLYSFEQQKSQPLEAHAAGFSYVKVRRCFDKRQVWEGSHEN